METGRVTRMQLARRVLPGLVEDELFTRAAALSFYFIFALFPMALSLMAILGLFAHNYDLRMWLLRPFGQLAPPSALDLIEETLREIGRYSSGWKLVLGLLLALWSGANGVSSIMEALCRCYRIRDSRRYWNRMLIAIGLTATLSALTMSELGIVLFGGSLVEFVGGQVGLSRVAI